MFNLKQDRVRKLIFKGWSFINFLEKLRFRDLKVGYIPLKLSIENKHILKIYINVTIAEIKLAFLWRCHTNVNKYIVNPTIYLYTKKEIKTRKLYCE